MEILKQHTEEREGNDCCIYKSVAIIKSNGEYLVVTHTKYTGWNPGTNCSASEFENYCEACKYYKSKVEGVF